MSLCLPILQREKLRHSGVRTQSRTWPPAFGPQPCPCFPVMLGYTPLTKQVVGQGSGTPYKAHNSLEQNGWSKWVWSLEGGTVSFTWGQADLRCPVSQLCDPSQAT